MAVVSVDKLQIPVLPGSPAVAKLSTLACVENDIDLESERRALGVAVSARSQGYKMYLAGKSPEDIAKSTGVDLDVVLAWSRDGGWAARMRRTNDHRETLVRESVRKIRLSRVARDVESSLRLGRRIREVVEAKLEHPEELRSMDIKNLADASKASVDTSAQGMGESMREEGEAGKEGRRPLVIVFQDGMPPRRQDATVIDVEESK